MAFETWMMNPPKRRFKFGASKRRKSYRRRSTSKVSITGLLKGRRRKGLRKSSSKLWSALRRGRATFARNMDIFGPESEFVPGAQAFGATSKTGKSVKYTVTTPAGVAIGTKRVRTSKSKKPGQKPAKRASKKSAKRYGGTRKRTIRKGTRTMAKRRHVGWKGSRRAHQIAWALGRAGKRRGKSRFSFLRKHGATKKRIAGYRRRHRMSRSRRLSGRAFTFMYKGRRIAANKRRSRRRYAKNGLSTWQKLVKAHGVKGAKRLYRGNRKSRRRSRRRYSKNRESYQIAPVAANRGRRYRRNRELYQVSPAFSTNPATAIMAFPKAIFSVPFIMKNVVPIGLGAVGSDLLAGLVTKYVLKDPKWSNAPWKKALLTAGAGALGGIGIGMATKGRKADWAYKFAAGGMLVAFIGMFNAYLKKSLGLSGMGLGEYSGIGYGSDDLKRRIAEELKTELDGVGGFITQEDLDSGISSSGGSVSGFVTAEDLPGEGSSISMDDFAATVAM